MTLSHVVWVWYIFFCFWILFYFCSLWNKKAIMINKSWAFYSTSALTFQWIPCTRLNGSIKHSSMSKTWSFCQCRLWYLTPYRALILLWMKNTQKETFEVFQVHHFRCYQLVNCQKASTSLCLHMSWSSESSLPDWRKLSKAFRTSQSHVLEPTAQYTNLWKLWNCTIVNLCSYYWE